MKQKEFNGFKAVLKNIEFKFQTLALDSDVKFEPKDIILLFNDGNGYTVYQEKLRKYNPYRTFDDRKQSMSIIGEQLKEQTGKTVNTFVITSVSPACVLAENNKNETYEISVDKAIGNIQVKRLNGFKIDILNGTWLDDIMELQAQTLINSLLGAGEFTQLPVISSTRSQYPFEGYYTIAPKLKEIPLEERIKLGQENDPDDNWSVLMDAIYESRTMGEMDDDQEDKLKGDWLDSHGIPKYIFNATIFTDQGAISDLPFNGFDFHKLASIILYHCNFQPGIVTFVNGTGILETYPIVKL